MIQVNEYAFAMMGFLVCGLCCLTQIYVWTNPPKRYPRVTRSLLGFLCVAVIVIGVWDAWKIKSDRPWTNLLAQQRQDNPQIGNVQIKEGETVTARIRQWGTSGEHDAFVILNSIELAPIADDYRLLVICRAQDNKLDAREDLRIDKSAMFTISGTEQRLEVALSQDTMRRLVPQGLLNLYVLLVPAKINPKEIQTIKEFTQNGAHVRQSQYVGERND
jgi:hypothetical protein